CLPPTNTVAGTADSRTRMIFSCPDTMPPGGACGACGLGGFGCPVPFGSSPFGRGLEFGFGGAVHLEVATEARLLDVEHNLPAASVADVSQVRTGDIAIAAVLFDNDGRLCDAALQCLQTFHNDVDFILRV